MKYLTTILLMMFTISILAQTRKGKDQQFFIEFGIDPKMAIEGPYKDKSNDTNGGSLNFELKVGFEYEKQLFGLGYESHSKINYTKWTLFYEHKFNDKILFFINANDFTTRIGPEIGLIKRKYVTDDSYDRNITHDWLQAGLNGSVSYTIHINGHKDTGIDIGLNYNIFRGEENYRRYKKTFIDQFRNDVMFYIRRRF